MNTRFSRLDFLTKIFPGFVFIFILLLPVVIGSIDSADFNNLGVSSISDHITTPNILLIGLASYLIGEIIDWRNSGTPLEFRVRLFHESGNEDVLGFVESLKLKLGNLDWGLTWRIGQKDDLYPEGDERFFSDLRDELNLDEEYTNPSVLYNGLLSCVDFGSTPQLQQRKSRYIFKRNITSAFDSSVFLIFVFGITQLNSDLFQYFLITFVIAFSFGVYGFLAARFTHGVKSPEEEYVRILMSTFYTNRYENKSSGDSPSIR